MSNKKIKFFIIIIPLILVYIWFKSGYLIGGAESGLPFYDLERQYETYRYTWAAASLGTATSLSIAVAPFYFISAQLENIGLSHYLIEALVFALLFIISGLAIFHLSKEFFPKLNDKYLLISVLFYWFNPISIVNVWNRSLINFMFFWTLLPLVVFLFISGLRRKKLIYSIYIAIISLCFSYALASTTFNILLVLVFVYISFFEFWNNKKQLIFIIKYLLLTLFLYFGMNLWWISQLFTFLSSPEYHIAKSKFFSDEGNIYTLTILSQNLGILTNTLKFIHVDYFLTGPKWGRIYLIPIWGLMGSIPSLIILWVIYKYRKIKEVIFLGLLFFLTLFLMKGNQPPFGEIFQFFFVKLPFIQVFRNPFEKFGFLLPLAAAPLFAFGVHNLVESTNKIILKRIYFLVPLLIVVLLWGFPFWTGLIFTRVNFTDNSKLDTYEVSVPSYYKDANNWLNTQGDNFRFVSLPLGGEGMTYTWEKPYSGVELSSTLFDTPNISFNTTLPYYNEMSSSLFKTQLDDKFLSLLPFTNSKFIILREDINSKERNIPDPETSKKFLSKISQDELVKMSQFGKLSIYKVDDKWFWPKIFFADQVIATNNKNIDEVVDEIEGMPKRKVALVDSDSSIPFSKIVLYPDNISVKDLGLKVEIVYEIEVPLSNKYRLNLNIRLDENTNLYLDGNKINIANFSDFWLNKGKHTITITGPKMMFYTPVLEEEKLSLDSPHIYEENLKNYQIDKKYLINFDFLLENNDQNFYNLFKIKALSDVDLEDKPFYSKDIIASKFNEWENWNGEIKATDLSKSVKLIFSKVNVPFCNFNLINGKKCSDIGLPFKASIKNLKILEENLPKLNITSLNTNSSNIVDIHWKQISPVLYEIDFVKQNSDPQVLVFSELYNSGWKLYDQNSLNLISPHFLANFYANGWLLDKMGEYKLRLEFSQEKIFDVAVVISCIIILISILVIIYIKLYEKSK